MPYFRSPEGGKNSFDFSVSLKLPKIMPLFFTSAILCFKNVWAVLWNHAVIHFCEHSMQLNVQNHID